MSLLKNSRRIKREKEDNRRVSERIKMCPVREVPKLVQNLYEIVSRLEELFPGRPFTPDGHLVGSIGEVIAAHRYRLRLLPCSAECHDAVTECGTSVQIKATQGKSVGLRHEPNHLIVLKLKKCGDCEEVYNGPGALPWSAAGSVQSNGQRNISLTKLKNLMSEVPLHLRVPAVDL